MSGWSNDNYNLKGKHNKVVRGDKKPETQRVPLLRLPLFICRWLSGGTSCDCEMVVMPPVMSKRMIRISDEGIWQRKLLEVLLYVLHYTYKVTSERQVMEVHIARCSM